MKLLATFFVAVTASLALLVGGMGVAEAKRVGNGQSFGSKFSHNQDVNRNASSPNQMQKTAATPAQQTNADRKQALASKGGMMGMLGALAIGGLLGALFFGGAFEGVNFMDVLLFALLGIAAFMIFRTLMRRNQPQPAAAAPGGYAAPEQQPESYQTRQSVEQSFGGGSTASQSEGPSLDSLRGAAPKGFDGAAFVEGAKNCFVRLQRAWDEGDLADIRLFTTDHVFGEIQDQFRSRIGSSNTEVLALDAELLSATDLGSKQEAIVLFKAQLREDGSETQADEVWHFVKSGNGSWQLDGIQQVAG